ncbi:MAG: response regulator [Actinomycetaceae bacterium]|nr:response regulator [Actinomycetaceae bacterium]
MKLTIISLEDEPEVRDAVVRDLAVFEPTVRVEPAENVDDVWEVIKEIDEDGDVVAVVLADHRMPGTTGVDFLVAMGEDERTAMASKILLTGQADQADTIKAVNQAGLDHYIAKPWKPEELQAIVREELTAFVMATEIDPLPHLDALNAAEVMEDYKGRVF